jgi:hypothetical protein
MDPTNGQPAKPPNPTNNQGQPQATKNPECQQVVFSHSKQFSFYPIYKACACHRSLIKTFEKGFGQRGTNINIFNLSSPCPLGVQNEVIPTKVFNLGFMSFVLG